MNVILILICVSLALALTFLISFIWAVKSGQFEDTCTPSLRLLSEEERISVVNQNKLANRSKNL